MVYWRKLQLWRRCQGRNFLMKRHWFGFANDNRLLITEIIVMNYNVIYWLGFKFVCNINTLVLRRRDLSFMNWAIFSFGCECCIFRRRRGISDTRGQKDRLESLSNSRPSATKGEHLGIWFHDGTTAWRVGRHFGLVAVGAILLVVSLLKTSQRIAILVLDVFIIEICIFN